MLAGLVLAGGKSSRMGTDKSALILPDTQHSMLTHAQQKLAQVCDGPVLISGGLHPEGIADLVPDCGPLSGIHAAISHIQQQICPVDELLVTAVDMPDVPFNDLLFLVTEGRQSGSLCCYQNCYLPLYMPLTTNVVRYLHTLLVQANTTKPRPSKPRRFAVKTMVETLHGMQLPMKQNTQFDNINTLEQWHQRCAKHTSIKAIT